MNIFIILLRLLHIFFAVFWVGTTFALAAFIQPTSRAAGWDGIKFMQRLVSSGMTMELTFAGPMTILSGLALYWIDSSGLSIQWITSGSGIAFTIGGISGIAALLIALFVNRPIANSIAGLGTTLPAPASAPTTEQVAKMMELQEKLTQGTIRVALLVSVALAAMATARYW